ncbi:MAG: PocR ligand-binding domain-containing protein [Syntrophomonas sp.]|nr:PocR ligand-binding domain-containing protein [Syntrophomonas sp.]
MKDENKTKKQLIDELTKLRQRNIELELAPTYQDYSSTVPELSSPSRWFSTGRSELFVSDRPEHQAVNLPIKYKLSDLVDIPFLKRLLNSFYMATGIPHGLHDEDNNILSGKGWQDICAQFHRACPQTECRCKQSDSYIFDHLHEGSYIGYKCMNGLMDFGTPIIVEGQHLGSIFLGQFLHELPDEEFFRRQAQEFGFDEAAYMEALRRVPVIPEDQVESIMKFYSELGRFLATMGLERKHQLEAANHTINEREERLRLVLDGSTDGFWVWNIETDEIYRSERWAEILGCSLEEIEPCLQSWKKLLHPSDMQNTIKLLNEHLDGRTSKYEVEYRLITESGELKWISERGRVVSWNNKGKPIRMAGTGTDITERKRMEEAMRLSEDKFSKAFCCNPVPISITTINKGRYVEVNDAWLEYTGFQRDEVIGHTSTKLSRWAVPEERGLIIKQIQEHGKLRNLEAKFKIKSGEIRTVLLSADIIDMGSEPHLLFVSKDITEEQMAEKRSQELMLELQSVNLELKDFAYIVSHDLKAPLRGIRSLADWLYNDYKDKFDEEGKEQLDMLINRVDRMNNLIEGILRYSRLTSKNEDKIVIDFNEAVKEVIEMLEPPDNISIIIENELPSLTLERTRTQQLFTNLINNAIKFMDKPNGEISISCQNQGEFWQFRIQDNGCGIEEKNFDNIFTIFKTLKPRDEFESTGIGLTIVKKIVEIYGGKVWVESKLGEGSTFYFTLPSRKTELINQLS